MKSPTCLFQHATTKLLAPALLIAITASYICGQTPPVIDGLEALNMEWIANRQISCGAQIKWRQEVNGLLLRIEGEYLPGSCPRPEKLFYVYEVDLMNLKLERLEEISNRFSNRSMYSGHDMGGPAVGVYSYYFKYEFDSYEGKKFVRRTASNEIIGSVSFSDATSYNTYHQALLHVVRQLYQLYSVSPNLIMSTRAAQGFPSQEITYNGQHSELIRGLLTHPTIAGTYSLFNCDPNSPQEIKAPVFSYNSFSKADKLLRLAVLYAYSAEVLFRCGVQKEVEFANFLAGRAFDYFNYAVQDPALNGGSVITQSILNHGCTILGQSIPFPNYTASKSGSKTSTGSGQSQKPSGGSFSGGSTSPTAESASAKAKKQLLVGVTKPSELLAKMKRLKESAIASTNKKISLLTGKDESCSSMSVQIPMTGTPLSRQKSVNSYEGEIYWSEWVMIPNTTLAVRYSKRKDCYPLEVISNSVPDMAQMAFDYGFIQFTNSGSATVSFKVKYQSLTEDASVYEGSEPGYLKPGELEAEELGNWFIGCDLITLSVSEFCTYTN